jgi:hypothetical protein
MALNRPKKSLRWNGRSFASAPWYDFSCLARSALSAANSALIVAERLLVRGDGLLVRGRHHALPSTGGEACSASYAFSRASSCSRRAFTIGAAMIDLHDERQTILGEEHVLGAA